METKDKPTLTRASSIYKQTHPNPFIHRIEWKPYHYLLVAVMSVTIAPLRMVSSIVMLLVCSLVCFVEQITRPAAEREPEAAVDKVRRDKYVDILRVAVRALFFCMGFHNIEVKGEPASVEEAPIIVCAPHSSFYDGIVFIALRFPSVVSRIENRSIPLLGPMFDFVRPVYVSRMDPDSRKTTIGRIKHRANHPELYNQLMIFPEGTCENRTYLITFKQGAFIPGKPVQPVVLRFNNRFDTYSWSFDGPGGLMLVWLTLCQLSNNVTIEILPPYIPDEEEKKDSFLFSKRVRQVMADRLGVGVTDHTYEDCRLMMYAEKVNYPMTNVAVEFDHLRVKLGLNFDLIQKLLERYIQIDKKRLGRLRLEEFAECLSLPLNESLQEMFTLFDRDESGVIDFREFVIGMMLVCEPLNTDATWESAFSVFDQDGDRRITREDLTRILLTHYDANESHINAIFTHMNKSDGDTISYEEFISFARSKPELAFLFSSFQAVRKDSGVGVPSAGDITEGYACLLTTPDEIAETTDEATESDDNSTSHSPAEVVVAAAEVVVAAAEAAVSAVEESDSELRKRRPSVDENSNERELV